jgi:hypothetical protein
MPFGPCGHRLRHPRPPGTNVCPPRNKRSSIQAFMRVSVRPHFLVVSLPPSLKCASKSARSRRSHLRPFSQCGLRLRKDDWASDPHWEVMSNPGYWDYCGNLRQRVSNVHFHERHGRPTFRYCFLLVSRGNASFEVLSRVRHC